MGVDAATAVRLRAAIDRVLGGAGECEVRHQCTPADGVTRWFDSRFFPEADAQGAPCAVLCVSRDVTADVAAEEARRVRETQFELLYSAAPLGVGRTALDGRWLDANPRLLAMLGYTLDELRAMSSADITVSGDAVLSGAALLALGDDHQAVKRYRRKDGTLLWASVSVRVVRDADGEPLHIVGIAEDVSERVAADRALRESEARFRALVEQSPLSTVVLDREGRVTAANPAFARLWGIRVADVPADWSVLTDPQSAANGARAAFERALAGEYVTVPPAHYADRRVGDPSVRRWVQNVYYPIADADGAVGGVVCIQEDVSARREAEAALRESEARLRAVFEHVPIGISVSDAAEGFKTSAANAALCRILGYSAEELAHMHFGEFTHPDDLAEDERLLAEVEAGLRDHYSMEKRLVRRDGTLRWAHLTIAAVRDADGRPRYMVAMTKDITERKLIEAELRRRERELASLTDNSPDVVTRYGADLRVRFMSGAFERSTGMPAGSTIGRHIAELPFPEELLRLYEDAVRGIVEGGGHAELEFDFTAPDGTLQTWSAQLVPERDEAGRVESVLSVTRDVTERARTRRALRESEERFRALVEHSSDLIAILEPDGRVRYASPAQSRLLGYVPADFPQLVAYDMLHPDDVELARRRLAGAATPPGDASAERPLRIRRRDGTYRSFLVRVSDLRDDAAVGGIVVNARDVTEELRLQERLAQAQKMEALGQLAGGVAHDFNNILAAITSYGQLLLGELPAGSPAAEDAAEIVRAAARGAAVTGQLLAFSRRQALETEVIELGQLVRDTARMLRPLLPSSIGLRLPDPDVPPVHVRAARAQVEQILVNLAVNARDAMPGGGEIDVRVATRPQPDGAVDALLVVADSGVGMSSAVRSRAFEPFFTTKPAGRGTGLGLATVYGLVRQFGGTIEVESHEGAGTTFTLALPLAAPSSAAAVPPGAQMPAAPRGARLLLAEDEEQVRASLARALGRAGHAVVAVPDGQAALDLLRAGERVDLVLSDVAMPRLGGRELAAALAREFPALPIVLMSGYAELDGASGPESEVASFVAKPFDVSRLLHIVDELLRASAP